MRLLQLLHMSKRTFYKLLSQEEDGRRQALMGRRLERRDLSIDQFFLELYHSAAEMLPPSAKVGRVDECFDAEAHDDREQDVHGRDDAAAIAMPAWDPESALLDEVHRLHLDPHSVLPRKFLHHQHLSELWWQYVAWTTTMGSTQASHSTFYRRWAAYWKHCLGFRKSSEHAECNECSRYKTFLHFSHASPSSRREAAQNWRNHLQAQYHDRLLYWHARWWSKRRQGEVLTVIIDSMDKTKVAYPQYTFNKTKEQQRRNQLQETMTLLCCCYCVQWRGQNGLPFGCH